MKGVYIMSKLFYPSLQFFTDGRKDAKLDGKMHAYFANFSALYRLGFLYETSSAKPRCALLIRELCREFTLMDEDLPNYIEISLIGKYSHRMLRRTLNSVGYRIPLGKIDSAEIHAWRIR